MQGMAVDSAGNLFVADEDNQRIRLVSHGIINTIAGTGTTGFTGDGGPALQAELGFPQGLAIGAGGVVYFADYGNNRVRVLTPVAGLPTSITLSAHPNPSVFGSLASLTATVAPASATGTVTFYDGVTVLGLAPVSAGVAQFNTRQLAAGARSLTARYESGAGGAYAPSLAANYTEMAAALLTSGFAAPSSFPAGSSPVSAAVADLNGDGFTDVAIADQNGGGVTVLLGNGSGSFTASGGSPFATGANPVSVAAGDFNGDGKADLAVANLGSNTVTILLGNGAGGFAASSGGPLPAAANPISVTAGDFNDDGIVDLAVASTGGTVSILLGTGTGAFTAAGGSTFAAGSNPSSLAIGDFDGDGNADLAVAGGNGNNVTVLMGDGNGGFAAVFAPFPAGTHPVSVAVADFNGDGNQDLAVANNLSNNLTILLGDGKGGFVAAPGGPFPAGTSPQSVAVGDFNGDGTPDLAVADNGGASVSVLVGDGNGGFTPAGGSPFAAGPNPAFVTVEDFNGDGKPDLLIADTAGNNVTILTAINTATQLKIMQQPSSAAAGTPIGNVAVYVEDSNGTLVSGPGTPPSPSHRLRPE